MKILKITAIFLMLIFVVINIVSETQTKIELQNYSGKIKDIKGSLFLVSEGDFFELELSTEEYMKEIKLELVNKDKITVNGTMEDDVITVHNLTKSDILYSFIDTNGKALWTSEVKKKPPYIVIPKKCIGCNLCIKDCPTQAIVMKKGIAVIDPVKCIGCGICANGNKKDYKGCPVDAIKIDE